MAFQVPSLSDVSRTIENGFSSAFYGKSGNLRVGVLKVFSKVIAGGCYLPILFCQYIFRNSFIDSADVENLVRFGGWYNLPHKVASPARGVVEVTFNGVAEIPSGSILVDPNTSDEYEMQDSASSNSSSSVVVKVKVVALNVGKQGNRTEETELKLRDIEVDGVTFKTESLGGGVSFDVSVNGIEEQWGEDVESYRKRLKYRRQHQPMGGADSDYKQWAEKFSQVTDAKVFGNFPNTNSVSVFCADYNSSISLNETELEEVRDYICNESRKPVTADVRVASVSPVSLGLTIAVPGIGGNIRKSIVDSLVNNLKGFGFGSTITTTIVKQILVENGITPSCSVTQMKIDGTDMTSAGYTFKKDVHEGSIRGEVVNINRIDELLTLVVG